MELRFLRIGFRPDGRRTIAGGLPLWAHHRISVRSSRPDGRCTPGSISCFPDLDPSADHFDPAPIRARTSMAALSGGRMSKATFATGYFPPPIRAKTNLVPNQMIEFHSLFMGTCT
ncbi:MAG TPA: hypothetical protein PLS70_09855 [Acidobacteriota bacterium]|nr:hypothetical protein [Acidobacteriota bacterium]